VRQYGREQLVASGEAEAVHDRHARVYLALVLTLVDGERPDVAFVPGPVLDRLEREYDNIRLALRWLLDHDADEPALRLGAALGQFWYLRGYLREGRQWLAEALEQAADNAPGVRAWALNRAAALAMRLADYPAARAWASEAEETFRGLGHRQGEAQALSMRGRCALDLQEYEPARALLEQSLALLKGAGDRTAEATVLHCLALVAYYQGDLPRSRRLQEQVLALRPELGEGRAIAACLNWLGHVAVAEGELVRARGLYVEVLGLHRTLGFAPGYSLSLSCFANLAAAQGQARRAVRLAAAATAQAEQLGVQAWTTTQAGIDKRVEVIRATLPAAEQEAAWAEGRAMTLEEAVVYAVAEEPNEPTR
jgi:non-specific serine/threonine protein kinase